MRNKVVKKLLIIAMAVTMISGTSIATVYANANPPAEETTTAVVEETTTEKNKDTEKAEDTGRVTGESNNSAFSTPGNAQLVDDKENDDTKQFLMAQSLELIIRKTVCRLLQFVYYLLEARPAAKIIHTLIINHREKQPDYISLAVQLFPLFQETQ